MPCTYDPPGTVTPRPDLDELDKITRIACEALKYIEAKPSNLSSMSGKTQKWWKQHKKEDAERIEREKLTAKRARFQPLDDSLIEDVAATVAELADNWPGVIMIGKRSQSVIVYMNRKKKPAGSPNTLRGVPVIYELASKVKPA